MNIQRKLFVAFALAAVVANAGDFRVAAEGGRAEIQQAIDAAAAAGGGCVVVAPGVHPIGTLRLKSHVELHLEEGAVLLASTNIADYAEFPREVCPVAPGCMYWTLIMAWDAEDIAITGKGVIDGQGPAFFDRKPPRAHFWPKPKARPRMVQFVRCKGVRLEGVTFKDSPQWTMFIRLCDDVVIDGIKIDADQRMINNDGIDFDGCRRVRVGNSFFKTGDDCIILRAMRGRQNEHIVCEDIVVSNCVLNSTCQSIRMGAPSDDTIRNALFKDIKIKGFNGIFFDYPARYVRPDDEGYMDISGIVFDGFEGSSYGSAIQIVAEPGIKIRGVRDVTFRNFNVKSAKPLRFVGNADSVLSNIVLDNITAEIKRGDPYLAVATEPLTFRNCTFNGKKVPDRSLVTPRGERKPLNRSNRSSWETVNQSLSGAVIKMGSTRKYPCGIRFIGENGDWVFCGFAGKQTKSDPVGVSSDKVAGMPIAASRNGIIEDPVSKPLPRPMEHNREWVEEMRTRGPLAMPLEEAQVSSSACILGYMAMKLGRKLKWDAKAEKFIDDAEANGMMFRDERKGFGVKQYLAELARA